MTKSKDQVLREGVGNLASKILVDSLGEAFPGIDLSQSKPLKELNEGNLEAAKRVGREIKSKVIESATQLKENRFYGTLNEVTRNVVGSSILLYSSPGNILSGVITNAAGYSGEGDHENFSLPRTEPGTIGIWTSSSRGGYNVACISAHPDGQQGYVSIFEIVSGSQKFKMNDIADKFGFIKFAQENINSSSSPLKILLRNASSQILTPSLRVYSSPKKGKGCVCAYSLESSLRE